MKVGTSLICTTVTMAVITITMWLAGLLLLPTQLPEGVALLAGSLLTAFGTGLAFGGVCLFERRSNENAKDILRPVQPTETSVEVEGVS